jgi:serine/threonine protein kinase
VIASYDDVCQKCQEVRTLLRLRGGAGAQHILQVYEFFWTGHEVHIVMELLGTTNLREWLFQQDMFTEQQARKVSKSILTGLKYMHEKNVVHRDVKGENIMFRVHGDLTTLKIVDLGFACELAVGERATGMCGSLGYLAPEIYAGVPYYTDVDLFSFGVLLFRILSGEKPWPEAPAHATRVATMQLQYRVDQRQWLSVSKHGKDLVRRLLAYAPERISAAAALRHPWFLDRDDSILQADPVAHFPGARARTASRATIEDEVSYPSYSRYRSMSSPSF